jgi:hypothetical protein
MLESTALLSAAFLSLPLCAQFDNLVTTDDGSLLLFQSQWRLAGSGDGNLSKIYRWDSHGFTTLFSPVNPGLISPPFATSPVITKPPKHSRNNANLSGKSWPVISSHGVNSITAGPGPW